MMMIIIINNNNNNNNNATYRTHITFYLYNFYFLIKNKLILLYMCFVTLVYSKTNDTNLYKKF